MIELSITDRILSILGSFLISVLLWLTLDLRLELLALGVLTYHLCDYLIFLFRNRKS